MSAANKYSVRRAGPADGDLLHRIARLDTARPLAGDAWIGEISGVPAAAIALVDGRVIADPFMSTPGLTALLRARYRAYRTRLQNAWTAATAQP
jgi:hypothetical protein